METKHTSAYIGIHSLKATEDKYEPVLTEGYPVDLDKNSMSIGILKRLCVTYYAHFQFLRLSEMQRLTARGTESILTRSLEKLGLSIKVGSRYNSL